MKKRVYTCRCGHSEEEHEFKRCPSCGKWYENGEHPAVSEREITQYGEKAVVAPVASTVGEVVSPNRLYSGLGEFDRVMGGGLCLGTVTMITGRPGIGKSTLLSQAAAGVARRHGPVLYYAIEQSLAQTKERGQRIDAIDPNLFIVANDNKLEGLIEEVRAHSYALVVVDSLQCLQSSFEPGKPGSDAQMLHGANMLIELAHDTEVAIIVIGQITKDGDFAGPKQLEHNVDAHFLLEDQTLPEFRLLRVRKNRNGPDSEVGAFRMLDRGFINVPSPSKELCGGSEGIITVALEGRKPIATKIQVRFAHRANLSAATCGFPKDRLRMICAIFALYNVRIPLTLIVNAVGGYRIRETAADAAVALCAFYARRNQPAPAGWAALGEISLDGRLLPPAQLNERVQELELLEVPNVIVPKLGSESLVRSPNGRTRLIPVETLREAVLAIAEGDREKIMLKARPPRRARPTRPERPAPPVRPAAAAQASPPVAAPTSAAPASAAPESAPVTTEATRPADAPEVSAASLSPSRPPQAPGSQRRSGRSHKRRRAKRRRRAEAVRPMTAEELAAADARTTAEIRRLLAEKIRANAAAAARPAPVGEAQDSGQSTGQQNVGAAI